MTLDSNRSFLDKNTSLIESQEETVIITHYIEVKKSIKPTNLKNNFSSFLSSFKSVKQISKKLSSFLAQCVFCFVLILTKVYTLLFDQSRCNQVREKT
jgi:UDP-N-acetylglucosamine:LPS N-acetylglucosamine transferase